MTTSMNVKTGTSKKGQAAPDPVKYERMTAKMAFQLAMIHTWPASVCPALFGIFWCLFRGISLTPAQCILLAAACILSQSSVNTLNDYVDYVNGTDSEEDNVEVSDAVLVYNHLNPRHALILGLVYLASAALCGVTAAGHSGPAPYVVGIIGGLTVLAYSVSPVSVASLPLGELVSGFVMGGLIPLGTAAVADGTFHWEILPECLPLIIGIALIMLSNNGSDIEKDRIAGRTTLPVVLGRPRSLVLYRTMLGVWIALLILQPLLQVGWIAIAGILLTIALGHKPFGFILRAKLDPSDRIRQMKSITASNMIGNGFLALTYGAAWLLRILKVF